MRKLLFYVAFIICSCTAAYSQQYIDCDRAAEINDAVFGPVNPNGNKDKAVIMKHGHGLYFEQGHNITWLTFVVPNDTILTFDLVPQNASDNLDFLLYRDDDDFCRGVAQKRITPIRSNLALPDTSTHSGTIGISATATDTMVTSGFSQYCKTLPVKRGERYYIVVDNWSETKGSFTLNLHLGFPKYVKPQATESRDKSVTTTTTKKNNTSTIDAVPIKAPPIKHVVSSKMILHVMVVDSSNSAVKAQMDVTGLKSGKVITEDTSEYEFTLARGQTVNINCNAKGYMFTQASYTAIDTEAETDLTIRLSRVMENKAVVLNGIQFHEGNAVFLPSSQNALMNVLEFMRSNPTVNIVVKGYVNDPGSGNSGAAKKLSKERAEAVMDFLIAAGVGKKRIDYKGYGNSHMLFPNPATDEQAQANRRVEIEVVK